MNLEVNIRDQKTFEYNLINKYNNLQLQRSNTKKNV